ncbi:hypothetical protein BJ166DRAFT_492312 [Pestalotiopsis sp. NC0098]|nr:hypothetical protein BJ166DRAFT_492312 [Pestalotiopsis sp. NC0098]
MSRLLSPSGESTKTASACRVEGNGMADGGGGSERRRTFPDHDEVCDNHSTLHEVARAQRARKSKGLELYSWVYHIQSECSRLCKSIRGRRLDMSEALATQRCVSLTLGSSQSILNPYARATGRVEARLRGDDSSQLDGYWMPGSRRLRLGFIEAVFEAARLHASELMRTRTENPCISKSYAVHRTVTEDLGNSSKAGLHRRLPYQYGHKMLV